MSTFAVEWAVYDHNEVACLDLRTKDNTCYHCKEVGHCKRNCSAYLAELIKKKKKVGTASLQLRILNMVPTKKVDKTPYEIWYGKVLNLSYLKVWGVSSCEESNPDKLNKDLLKEEDITPSEITSNITQEVEGFEPPQPPQEEVIPIHRSGRTHRAPNHLCLNVEVEENSLGDLNEPTSYKAAMLDSESNKMWTMLVNAEIKSLMDKYGMGPGRLST
ncbi:retrotransposon protein, putative, ty1-copia subclass [Tanacetum coccineum]